MKENWKIRITGYGTIDFIGTEVEAESMRVYKARWENAVGIKWRTDLSTELDRVCSEIAASWDRGEGIPESLMIRLKKAQKFR